jgi:hypothetical protein
MLGAASSEEDLDAGFLRRIPVTSTPDSAILGGLYRSNAAVAHSGVFHSPDSSDAYLEREKA